jgi:hypothetical protein
MKLVAIIENVNQKANKNLIGDIVIVDSEYKSDLNDILCFEELEHGRYWKDGYTPLQSFFELRHEVSNISIIGVL